MSEYCYSKTQKFTNRDVEHEKYICKGCGIIHRVWFKSTNSIDNDSYTKNYKENSKIKVVLKHSKSLSENKVNIINFITQLYNKQKITNFINCNKGKIEISDNELIKFIFLIKKLKSNFNSSHLTIDFLKKCIYKSTIFCKEEVNINYNQTIIKTPIYFKINNFLNLIFHSAKPDELSKATKCPVCGFKILKGETRCMNCKFEINECL